MFAASLAHNLRRLHRFGGRTSPALFWPYVLTVLVLVAAGMAAAIVPQMLLSFGKMQAFAVAHPDQATVVRTPGSYSISIEGWHPELMPDLPYILTILSGLIVLAVSLVAAAVARRLHDRGRGGWWGMLPVPFLLFSLVAMRMAFAVSNEAHPDGPTILPMLLAMFASNLIYLAALVWLVVMLAGRGTPGNNRFGPEQP